LTRSPVLVTGAAGFAGSHLLDLLDRERADVIAWHRPGSPPPRELARTTWEGVDLMDRRMVAHAIRRSAPSAVYHFAGEAHVGRAWDDTTSTFAINVRGTHFLIDALREASPGVPLLVPSSAMIYRAANERLTEDHAVLPSSPYGVSKLAQELLASRACHDGIGTRIARAFNHVGPRQDPSFAASGFARQIAEIEAGRREPEIVVGNLEARREITDVRDTVRAYRAILERGRAGRPYNVCSGRAIAIGEVVERLVARSRARVHVRIDPARFRPNDLPLVEGDPTRIREELGWTPEIPFEQTLHDLLAYWRGQMESLG
jgi:GDP-4-dehydro-6-deoxy-D-mannose reductase